MPSLLSRLVPVAALVGLLTLAPGSAQQPKLDPKVGGSYEITMQGQSGPIVHKGVYQLIDRPKKLVFTWASPGTELRDTLVTVDFLAMGKRTEIIVTHEQLPESARPSHSRGWTSGLEHLDEACQKGLLG